MSMPTISDINPDINITREDAINVIIASIAMEELSLAHILNAEGEKIQFILGTLKGAKTPDEVTICDVMAVNESVQKTLRDVIKAEMLLQFKLEDAVELAESGGDCRITIKGQKIWRDSNNVAGKRPAYVEIRLLRDDVVYGTPITVSSKGDGKFSFACLPVSNESGHRYTYTVDEAVVPEGYTKKVEGFNIINTIEPGTIAITGSKTWDDDDDSTRPTEIKINLLQNGEQIKYTTIASNIATFSFTDVPRFDAEGNLFVYTLTEDKLEEYVTTINGHDITNTIK